MTSAIAYELYGKDFGESQIVSKWFLREARLNFVSRLTFFTVKGL